MIQPLTECVVMLHGIMRTSRCMNILKKQFEQRNYAVFNVDYPSTKHTIPELADKVYDDIKKPIASYQKVHFIGFSMGGLLIHALLKRYDIKKLGRVVMLGTPNGGSEVADILKPWMMFRYVYGPAGQQLITDQTELDFIERPVPFELGVIAGSLDMLSGGWWLISQDNDGLVSVESTIIQGMKDHLTLPLGHYFLPINKEAAEQTVHFIENGVFET